MDPCNVFGRFRSLRIVRCNASEPFLSLRTSPSSPSGDFRSVRMASCTLPDARRIGLHSGGAVFWSHPT